MLAAHVRAAAHLEDLDSAASLLTVQGVAQDRHIVRDELLEAEPADRPVVVDPLGADHHGGAGPFDALGESEQGAARRRDLLELRDQRADRVDRDALRPDPLDGVRDPAEQGSEVEVVAVEHRVDLAGGGVHELPLARTLPRGDVPPERAHVATDPVGAFLEGDEHPGFVGGYPAGEELAEEHRLAAAGRAGHERESVAGQASVGDQLQAGDACVDALELTGEWCRHVRASPRPPVSPAAAARGPTRAASRTNRSPGPAVAAQPAGWWVRRAPRPPRSLRAWT